MTSTLDPKVAAQVQHAPQEALFLSDDPQAVKEALVDLKRPDVQVTASDLLQDDNKARLRGLPADTVLVIDYRVKLTLEQNNNLLMAAAAGLRVIREVPLTMAKIAVPTNVKLQADAMPWQMRSTGLIIRTETGKYVGKLKLVSLDGGPVENQPDKALALMNTLAAKISGVPEQMADVLPQHEETATVKRVPEAGDQAPSPA